ncbi:glutamate--tRNA ligase [Candidatus Micrarchaeota archaeon CG1_02_47_40]|nr:MAG: glutamate--tRNA ligase [Candidatus Micrarchaeota archaeon CG1_02_47_40]
MHSLENIIRKHALRNAFDYGKTSPNSIIGKIIHEFADAKKDVKGAMEIAQKICKEVNKMGKAQIEEELKNYSFEEKKEEEKKGIELEGATEGKVITRFPPEPSGYLHIGHAKAAFIDYEAAKKYKGKFLLRFDDTNPEKEKEEFVLAIQKDLKWLGIVPDEVLFASDYMREIYSHAHTLIKKGKAYICTCASEEMKKARMEGKECACRKRNGKENTLLFEKMTAGEMEEGEAAIRFRGEMNSQNTAMRDPTLMRMVKAPHYRQANKYSAWPSYDFEGAIMDSIGGITHAMRTKEYELRDELYFAILDALSLRKPALIEFSRLQIKGMPVSKRLITPLIEEGKVEGYDDFRLPTLRGLARRGILPRAIKEFVLSFGISKVESEPNLEKLLSENKKLIDKTSPRLFFAREPVKIEVKNAPQKEALLRNHPTEKMGERKVKAGNVFYIPKKDALELKAGSTFRLKGLYNVKVEEVQKGKIICTYEGDELIDCPKIQWVCEGFLNCRILIPHELFIGEKFNEENLTIEEGYCEGECAKLKIGAIVQFERYGFARLDKISKELLTFIYISS